jgi:hypothetical protein
MWRALLPWYLNNTLSSEEKQAVEAGLRLDPDAGGELPNWHRVQETLTSLPAERPSPEVWQRVAARVQAASVPSRLPVLPRLAWGIGLAAAVLFLLWVIIQPGIELQWSVDGETAAGFRIYRAPVGTAEFGLLAEVQPGQDTASGDMAGFQSTSYVYMDSLPLPGQKYTYLVQAIDRDGQPVASRTIVADGWQALPAQMAIILTSLLVGFGAVLLVGQRMPLPAQAGC